MSKRSIGLVFVVFGVIMVIAALLLTAMYEKREADAGYYSEMIMAEYKQDTNVTTTPVFIPDMDTEDEPQADEPAPIPEMPTADYYGLRMLGVIRVPECGIELPVLDNWSMSTLEYAPCRYFGNIYSNDLIIMGHNYTTHFKPLKKVTVGASVEFESVDGSVWHYIIDSIDSVHRNDVEKLPSEHELILFTCEEYGVYRFVARCSLIDAAN